MQFLLKDEIEHILNTYADKIAAFRLEDLFSTQDIDSFDIFRYCVFCLLNNSNDSTIFEFIRTFPAVYDHEADIFVPSSQP